MPTDDQAPDAIRLIAHDLRNPLTAIQLNAQLIERAAARDGRAQELRWATLITGATRRLDDLIRQLVEAERLRTGQLELTLVSLAWDQLLRDVLAPAAMDDPGSQQVRLVVPAAPVVITGDRERLGRVMRELAHLTALSSEAGMVAVELALADGRACCSLLGPAPGAAVDEADAAAGPPARTEPGQAITLHFARTVVEKLGGTLRAAPANPRSVGFVVELPPATSSRT